MGIIQRQAFKNSIASFLSTGIAGISVLFIYPLSEATFDAYGLAQFVIMSAIFFTGFASFGTPALIVKFFPSISDDPEQKKAYLFNMLTITTGIFTFFLLLAVLFKYPIYSFLENLNFDVPLIRQYALTILGLTYINLVITVVVNHTSNYHRIVVPEICQNLIPKIWLPALILLYYWEVITISQFIWLWVLCYICVMLALILYLGWLGGLDLKPRLIGYKKALIRKMISFAGFNGLGLMGNILTNRIDVIMVATLVGTEEAGFYTIALFIANIIYIPTKAIWSIANPIISRSWTANDTDNIHGIYKKASLNLLVLGIFMYFLLGGLLDPVFSFSSNYSQLTPAIAIFLWLGIAKLTDMGSSVNYQIIMYSRFYRVNLFFTLAVGIMNTVLNYFLINSYGVVGAAVATAISVTTTNLIRMTYIKFRFDMHPFHPDSIRLLVLLIYSFLIYYYMPDLGNPFLQIIAYSLALGLPYIFLVYKLDLAPDMLSIVRNTMGRIKSLRR